MAITKLPSTPGQATFPADGAIGGTTCVPAQSAPYREVRSHNGACIGTSQCVMGTVELEDIHVVTSIDTLSYSFTHFTSPPHTQEKHVSHCNQR